MDFVGPDYTYRFGDRNAVPQGPTNAVNAQHTVDGTNPLPNHRLHVEIPINNRINYQPQLNSCFWFP